MAPRGTAAKIVKRSKISKRKPRSISPSADDSDSDFNIESNSEAVASKRRSGRGISSSKTITHCVTKPSIKVTRSMKTGVQAAAVAQPDEPKEPEEVPYWQRRRPLTTPAPHMKSQRRSKWQMQQQTGVGANAIQDFQSSSCMTWSSRIPQRTI